MAPDHPGLNRLLWPANPREVETHGGTVWTTCAACEPGHESELTLERK